MLKDVTLGQYFPGDSPVHRIDPRMKLILTVAYIALLFASGSLISLSVGIIVLLVVYPLSRIPISMALKSLKPIIPIILITSVFNMFFTPGEVLFQWWIITITDRGVMVAVTMGLRIMCLIAGTSILTYTTSPISLTDGIEQLFAPLGKIGAPVHEIAMMMTIALRFIPTLIEETDKIMSAQKARGADMESGNFLQRIRAMVPILIPLFVSAFRRAEDLALAMECRCYHGGEGRTRMHVLHFSAVDAFAAVFMALCVGGVVALNLLDFSVLGILSL